MALYKALRRLFHYVLRLNFRRITVIGAENVPSTGPLILTGNHQNQFVDSLLLVSEVDRPVSFLIAKKSLRRPIIGHLARALHAIGVERPQDVSPSIQEGTVSIHGGENKLHGHSTIFSSLIEDSFLLLSNGNEKQKVKVAEVLSDTELILDKPVDSSLTGVSFALLPKVDHKETFDAVDTCLKNNGCLGIFPEGGSHDRTDFLPLKAGVAMMALSARAQGCDVRIVPCGLIYFAGNRFRSDVVVDFGAAFAIPDSIHQQYIAGNKREAVCSLLTEIENRMRETLITAPSHEQLRTIRLMRRLYQPANAKVHPREYIRLNQRISALYVKMTSDPDTDTTFLIRRVNHYVDQLQRLNLKDYQVGPEIDVGWASLVLFERIVYLLLLIPPALPGAIIASPVALVSQYLAEKERVKALSSSTVKVDAKDVVASYRLIVGVAISPIVFVIYSIVTYFAVVYSTRPDRIVILLGMEDYLWLTELAFFFLIMFVLTPILVVASVVCTEEAVAVFRSLNPLFMSLVPSLREERNKLYRNRQSLAQDVRKAIHEAGTKMGEGWLTQRVISQEAIRLDEESHDFEVFPTMMSEIRRSDSVTMLTSNRKHKSVLSYFTVPRVCALITLSSLLCFYTREIMDLIVYVFALDENEFRQRFATP
eukprot:Rmarinus@m.27315